MSTEQNAFVADLQYVRQLPCAPPQPDDEQENQGTGDALCEHIYFWAKRRPSASGLARDMTLRHRCSKSSSAPPVLQSSLILAVAVVCWPGASSASDGVQFYSTEAQLNPVGLLGHPAVPSQ